MDVDGGHEAPTAVTIPSINPPETPKRVRVTLGNITNLSSLHDTPRRRKTPSSGEIEPSVWHRLGQKLAMQDVIDAAKSICGHTPRQWQLDIFEKTMEGYDTFGIAGTGSGKSLVFVLLAIAAEMANNGGKAIITVCSG
ncbi:hypothetical protein H0H93_008789 [Arthromyces matolae]|nr:hypothetical protein H0H93_008789 [Arthromyces matolae]